MPFSYFILFLLVSYDLDDVPNTCVYLNKFSLVFVRVMDIFTQQS